ncbi:hypothetical protein I5535_06475 [Rhodobacteraceae bacterium F11138]|nr:hypothetical protein [Rhodobacteraceae bacterium F11138]
MGGATLLLSACENYEGGNAGPSNTFIGNVPEGVAEIAAPYQDLSRVRIDPADGCYVYQYVGPVETTFLPLRSKDGRPICARAPEAT